MILMTDFNSISKHLETFYAYRHSLYIYLPTPPYKQDVTHSQVFKQSLTGLNSEFSFP